MSSAGRCIFLDRDGTINAMVIDADHGTIDSPLNPDQVVLLPGVIEALARLKRAGFALILASNQPAAAQGKSTPDLLKRVHLRVFELLRQELLRQELQSTGGDPGGLILDTFYCHHRSEDSCSCRKPKPGLLEQAFQRYPNLSRHGSWMVGDGITDVAAGAALGLKTAYLGKKKCDACHAFIDRDLRPDLFCKDLLAFSKEIAP